MKHREKRLKISEPHIRELWGKFKQPRTYVIRDFKGEERNRGQK